MELAFHSRELRTLCEKEENAKRELGASISEVLKHRLADLRAATSIRDVVAGRLRSSEATTSQEVYINLLEGYRMVLCANHQPTNPITESGKIDWTKVSRVKILRIESDYGQHSRVPS